MNDVLLNKKESMERCIKQIKIYYTQPSEQTFNEDFLKQDAIALNLQRLCELAIDMANYIIKQKKLGLPKESKESFRLLQDNNFIPQLTAENLMKMVGFRNILVHEYQELDLTIMVNIIENHLDELVDYTNHLLKIDL